METYYTIITAPHIYYGLNYTDGINRCHEIGCTIAKIRNADENDQVIREAIRMGGPGTNTWIGLDNLDGWGAFKWVLDGSTLGPNDFADWCTPGYPPEENFPDNPSNGPDAPEHCAMLWLRQTKCDGFGRWNDAKCDRSFPQVACECPVTRPPTGIPTSGPTSSPTAPTLGTDSPTASPSTARPTASPVQRTGQPTSSPTTARPTNTPTQSPTGRPSTAAPVLVCPQCTCPLTIPTTAPSNDTGRNNVVTESSTTDAPVAGNDVTTIATGVSVFAGMVLLAALVAAGIRRRRKSKEGLPDVWDPSHDTNTGTNFWTNKRTGEFSWTNPYAPKDLKS